MTRLWSMKSPSDSKKIKPVNSKGNQTWTLIERADAEAEAPKLWPPDANSLLPGKDPAAGKGWRQKKRVTEYEVVEWHHWFNGHELGQTLGDGEGQGGLMCCSPWGCQESDMTWRLNNNNPSLAVYPGETLDVVKVTKPQRIFRQQE